MILTIYRDQADEFRWHLRRRGRIVAEGGEGYKRKRSLLKAVRHLFGGASFRTDDQTKERILQPTPTTL